MSSLFPVKDNVLAQTRTTQQQYQSLYQQSIDDNERFWATQAQRLTWTTEFTQVKDVNFSKEECHIKWFYDGFLNVSVNCIDRHLPEKAAHTALIFENDDGSNSQTITYQQLHDEVCQLANALKQLGISKGDRVTIYMPMILKLPLPC